MWWEGCCSLRRSFKYLFTPSIAYMGALTSKPYLCCLDRNFSRISVALLTSDLVFPVYTTVNNMWCGPWTGAQSRQLFSQHILPTADERICVPSLVFFYAHAFLSVNPAQEWGPRMCFTQEWGPWMCFTQEWGPECA